MNHQWWYTGIKCPKCEGDPTLQMVAYAADGELRFSYYCVTCKEMLHWRIYSSALAIRALMLDLEHNTPVESKPVKPPLRLKPPLLTEKDKEDAHDMGIDWDGE